MKRFLKIEYLIFTLGILTICSSWYSVKPASEYRYQKLLEQDQREPGSVSDMEWMNSEDDAAFTGLFLIIVGAAGLFLTTLVVFLVQLARNCQTLARFALILGISWIMLGVALHAFVWLT